MHPRVCSKARHIAFEVSQIRSSDPTPWLLLDLLVIQYSQEADVKLHLVRSWNAAQPPCASHLGWPAKRSVERLAPMNLNIGQCHVQAKATSKPSTNDGLAHAALEFLQGSLLLLLPSSTRHAVRTYTYSDFGVCWSTLQRLLPGRAPTVDNDR